MDWKIIYRRSIENEEEVFYANGDRLMVAVDDFYYRQGYYEILEAIRVERI